jgi:uncharacterized protein (DUF1697 family)
MALVVLLRGVNVGGNKTFRPSVLAQQLKHLDVVSIGAAGTFVVRKPVAVARVREEIASRLPFTSAIITFPAKDLAKILATEHFAGQPEKKEIVRFVSVLAAKPKTSPEIPFTLPPRGRWLVQVLAREDRFVFGQFRREMRVVERLRELDKIFGNTLTTRSWSTYVSIAKALER